MSEYQWIEFRAIESPLDADAVEFMNTQSSRAEIDQWRFANEYNFGSFRGDSREMLRRGYDLFVHYANFGCRSLYMRFGDGYEFADEVQEYTDGEQIWWEPDETGTGGILIIEPEGDAGTFDEIWDSETLASGFVPLWEMLRRGDMRPLYLAYLALCCWAPIDTDEGNEESSDLEPPVPPGLKKSHPGLERLGEYLEINGDLLEIAAEGSAELQEASLDENHIDAWIQSLETNQLTDTLKRILLDPRHEPQKTLRQLTGELFPPPQTSSKRRSVAEMWRKANANEKQRREALDAEAARKKAEAERLAREQHERKIQAIAKDPDTILLRIDKAVEERKRPAYQQAAQDLGLVEEALGPIIARNKAEELRNRYPSRSALHAEIRKVLER